MERQGGAQKLKGRWETAHKSVSLSGAGTLAKQILARGSLASAAGEAGRSGGRLRKSHTRPAGGC